MILKGTRIPLIEFSANWKRTYRIGASVKVLVGGRRKRIRGAFIAVHTHTGARQVFVRRGSDNYPIVALRSVSVPQAFNKQAVIEAVNTIAAETFAKNYEQQLVFLTSKKANG
jgi:predicted methyltransferase MtxX (methanogen marker protein 4)